MNQARLGGRDYGTRQVLIIAPSFPPQNHIGVYRAYRLAKYLLQYDWCPHVLTIDVNYVAREDPSLVEDLPGDVIIHTARYVEPSLRGVRRALARSNRGHNTSPGGSRSASRPMQDETTSPPIEHLRNNAFWKAYGYLQSRWLNNPDTYATWRWPALRAAKSIMRDHNIGVVWTTSPEFTGHQIGAELKREGAYWIADFQDPVTYLSYLRSANEGVAARQRRIEGAAVQLADVVTVASQGIGMILRDMYQVSDPEKFAFIPWGVDDNFLTSADHQPVPSYPYLVFPGMMFPQYGTQFLDVFGKALRDPDVRRSGIRLVIVGDKKRNESFILPRSRELGIDDRIEILDYLPQRQVIGLIQAARAGVLLSGAAARWWCLYAKQVEYMGMRKRVVALVPELSEARLHLNRTGLGVFLDGSVTDAARTLEDFILDRLKLPEINEKACDQFTARSQAKSFAEIFDKVVGTVQ